MVSKSVLECQTASICKAGCHFPPKLNDCLKSPSDSIAEGKGSGHQRVPSPGAAQEEIRSLAIELANVQREIEICQKQLPKVREYSQVAANSWFQGR